MLRLFLFSIILLMFSLLCLNRVVAEESNEYVAPVIFESQVQAQKYVDELFTGGSLIKYQVGDATLLVIYVFGSGVPVTSIAVYEATEGIWKRVRELYPDAMGSIAESYQIYVADNKLIVVGKETGYESVIYSAIESDR